MNRLAALSRPLVLGGALLLLTALVVLPLGGLGLRLLQDPMAGLDALQHPLNVRAAWHTLLLSVSVLLFTLVVGVPLGWLVGRTDLPGRSMWRAICTTPYVVPPYITAIAWITLLNPTNGLLNRALDGIAAPLDIYTLAGMTWVMGLAYTPFVMLATADSLSRMDASLEEQARIAGASPLRTLLQITLPMAAPGIWTGAGFVLAASAASFGVPYLLASGAVHPDFVLTTRIYQALDLDPSTGRPAAVALSIVLLAIGIGLPALGRLLQGRRRFTTVTGKATRGAPFALGRAKPVALAFTSIYAGVAVFLPLSTIAITSLMGNFGRGLGADNLTLSNYSAVLFERSDTLDALLRSLFLASAAATGAVLLGGLLGWLAKRTQTRGRKLVSWLARLPYAIPGTVLALALILTFSQEMRIIVFERLTVGIALADTVWMLGLAYMVKFLAFPVGNAEAGLEATDASLEEQARISGAGWGTTMAKITGPLLAPNLVAAWFLVFMPAFSEVTMSILLSGPDTRVVGTLLFDLQTYGDPPSAAVLAMVVTVLVLGGNAGLRLLSRGKVGL
ncbi:MAG: iron ABC transporter permease [Proteobacteria bacterium]|nr:iron ABC transporter permease [Pseudomonadota bacterium]